tara:strand:+ start:559 stop:729 length:171 start_codon:yes stop_codon:yes gene_type:complete
MIGLISYVYVNPAYFVALAIKFLDDARMRKNNNFLSQSAPDFLCVDTANKVCRSAE